MACPRGSGWMLAAVVAGCASPEPRTTPEPGITDMVLAGSLVGDWVWTLRVDEAGLHRVERERWHIGPSPVVGKGLVGTYDREVDVTATDGVPFVCNQRTRYVQRARYDLRVTVMGGQAVIDEVGFRAEPSPCDHGFRRLGHYAAQVRRDRLELRWEVADDAPGRRDGEPRSGGQILRRAEAGSGAAVWPGEGTTWNGPWRWDVRTVDATGAVREEREEWELTVGGSGAAATYRRTVTMHSATGAVIACAGAPRWSHVDHYVLEGALATDGSGRLELREVAADAAEHPCLDREPRQLDAVTAELDGEYVEMTWRGKRRQVLYRP
jgi:hypothetical protein